VADMKDHWQKDQDEGRLKDTFLGSFIIGAIIMIIWAGMFFIYLDRL
jgi:hypothetical protein